MSDGSRVQLAFQGRLERRVRRTIANMLENERRRGIEIRLRDLCDPLKRIMVEYEAYCELSNERSDNLWEGVEVVEGCSDGM